MNTLELPPDKLTLVQTENLMKALREAYIESMKKTGKELGREYHDEDDNILLEIQREKGNNFGRDYFSPIQIEELGDFFRIDEEYIRNIPVRDAMILDDAYQGTYEQKYSDIVERLGMTEFESEEEAERSLKEIHEKISGKEDEDSSPPPSYRF